MISKQELEEAGWVEEDILSAALECARGYEARGIADRAYLLKLVEKQCPKPDTRIKLSLEPTTLAEAITTRSDEEQMNLGAVRRQLRDFLRLPVIKEAAIMPDACPAGKMAASIPVGGVIAAEKAIFPAAHSADICCSMFATFFESDIETSVLLDELANTTRFGPGGRAPDDRHHHPVLDEQVWSNPFLSGLQEKAHMHLADQGDGNHFAFLGEISWTEDQLKLLAQAGHQSIANQFRSVTANLSGTRKLNALVTHHGSRGLGAAVYKRGVTAAVKHLAKVADAMPEALAWLDTDSPVGSQYWQALQYVSRWTRANHQCIHEGFLDRIESRAVTAFGNEHNFVWQRGDLFVHGKGATPAWHDEQHRALLGLIPLNMASPILVVLGKNNSDYLSFAPHGAGRNLSRRAVMRQFRIKGGTIDKNRIAKTIEEHTRGIDVRWFSGKPDFTETPSAYKCAQTIREQIEAFNLAEIAAEIQPLGCIMAGEIKRRSDEEEELTPKQRRQIQHRAERRKTRQRMRHADDWEDGL